METLHFRFATQATPAAAAPSQAVLCGVVGSGNLEILVRPGAPGDACEVTVKTSALGFGAVWEAVLAEFAAHHAAGGARIEINDMGATPAVVSLRLGQALGEYAGGPQ